MIDWSTLPSLTSLRAFDAYAKTSSVTQAGASLNVSHAAISQHIRALEAHLGLALVDRSGRSMALTPEGLMLAEALDKGFQTISDAVRTLTGVEESRAIHVTTTPSFAGGWLMPRLARFRMDHPEVDIIIDPNPGLRDPVTGGVDLALRFGQGGWAGLDATLLVPTGIAVVAAPSLVGTGEITPDAMAALPWIQELGLSETSRWMQGARDTAPKRASVLEIPGHLLLEAARSGQGLAVTASVWIRDDLAAGRLRLLHETEEPAQGYYLCTRPGVMRPSLRAFVRWLRREAREDAQKPTSQIQNLT